jgi:hypothetical protein
MRMKAEYEIQEMKIKAEMDSRILGSGSVVTENITAELQALREEIRQVRGELSQLKSDVNTNYIR